MASTVGKGGNTQPMGTGAKTGKKNPTLPLGCEVLWSLAKYDFDLYCIILISSSFVISIVMCSVSFVPVSKR